LIERRPQGIRVLPGDIIRVKAWIDRSRPNTAGINFANGASNGGYEYKPAKHILSLFLTQMIPFCAVLLVPLVLLLLIQSCVPSVDSLPLLPMLADLSSVFSSMTPTLSVSLLPQQSASLIHTIKSQPLVPSCAKFSVSAQSPSPNLLSLRVVS
jgi:hypothetical protein